MTIEFISPLPFEEALARLGEKHLLPTDLSSAEIRRQWDKALRERALFSARTTKAEILQEVKDQLGDLLNGETNIATARAALQDLYDGLAYTPEEGFAGEEGLIPPAERGSLRDLSSNKRVDLVLITNMRQMANFGFHQQGQSDFARYAWPCYELLRIYPRAVPRGMRLKKGALEYVQGEDWPARWLKAGGQLTSGRMIATKDSPIWAELGSSELFPDALDSAIPPFAFNSGFGWREISREECIALGVITENAEVQPSKAGLNDGLQTSNRFDPDFLKAVRQDLDLTISQEAVRLAANVQALRSVFEEVIAEALGWNAGNSDGAIKGWITRRAGKQIAAQAFDEAMKAGGHVMKSRVYLKVDSGMATKIKAATGLDVSGYSHAVDGASIRHIMEAHGNPAKEALRGQKAITKADFAKLPLVVSKPTSISTGGRTLQGLETISYRRKIGDETFVVEEVRSGKKQLVPKTMFKQ